jgi:hypothetical protein
MLDRKLYIAWLGGHVTGHDHHLSKQEIFEIIENWFSVEGVDPLTRQEFDEVNLEVESAEFIVRHLRSSKNLPRGRKFKLVKD